MIPNIAFANCKALGEGRRRNFKEEEEVKKKKLRRGKKKNKIPLLVKWTVVDYLTVLPVLARCTFPKGIKVKSLFIDIQ